MAALLVRFTQSPYGNALSQDGLDFALAATNYGHEVKALFENEGVLQLVKTDSVKGIKNHSKRLSSMPFFDIEDCYACTESAKVLNVQSTLQNNLVADELECQWVSVEEKLALMESADHVVTF